ncbi:zymogen granule membrane 16-like protein [Labeo rohita]|uniref:Zymogen granule membrane 16-like protein n=1 Tax=Labeo rohita TaxID=84645 RepID=A0A498LCA0_LABRO|nr:zymogen granule membrane 16-like protein [Labeo rohita]
MQPSTDLSDIRNPPLDLFADLVQTIRRLCSWQDPFGMLMDDHFLLDRFVFGQTAGSLSVHLQWKACSQPLHIHSVLGKLLGCGYVQNYSPTVMHRIGCFRKGFPLWCWRVPPLMPFRDARGCNNTYHLYARRVIPGVSWTAIYSKMFKFFLILSAVCAMGMAAPLPDLFSYSPAVGDGGGAEFSTASDGRITGIRVWESDNYWSRYIAGFQLRYESNWTAAVGVNSGKQMEMTLYDNEAITQISGKYYSGYIYELVFVTNQGRLFKVGESNGASFNFYPAQKGNELRFLSGQQNGSGITSIGAHWATLRSGKL